MGLGQSAFVACRGMRVIGWYTDTAYYKTWAFGDLLFLDFFLGDGVFAGEAVEAGEGKEALPVEGDDALAGLGDAVFGVRVSCSAFRFLEGAGGSAEGNFGGEGTGC